MSDLPDYDGAWKNALDAYFPQFMALLWPELHALVDWRHQPEFLDKELQRLAASAKHGRLHVDKLVRVRLLSGQNVLALIHVEIQGRGAGLPARMFGYHIRLREKHPQHPLASLAVYLHRGDGPQSETYAYEHWGSSLTFSFPVVSLERWRERTPQLLAMAPSSPFAVVVLAQLEANAEHPAEQRLVRKTQLVRRLYECKFERDQIMQLFNIMDAMLVLPASLEEQFVDAVNQIEEETDMTYINTVERVILKRERQAGKQEGKLEGAATTLAALLTRKFGELPEWVQARMAQADEATLGRWAVQILDAQRIEDVFL